MEFGNGRNSLLMKDHEVNGCYIKIILLTQCIHAYLLEFNEKYFLYLTDTSEYDGRVDLLKEFDDKNDALKFAHEFWIVRDEVQDYKEYYSKVKDKKATQKQIESTRGTATTFGEATWYFAKRTCYWRMKNIISSKKGQATRKRNKELKLSLMQ